MLIIWSQNMESMVLKMRKMKDSGIEWIGEIPEGWEISKVSYFYEVQLGKMLQPQKKSETDTEEKYLCAANVGKNSLSLDTLKTMWFSQTEKHQFDLKEGDLLVVEGGDVASCAIIETPIRNLFFQNALHRVRPLHNESVAFLRYWLMTAKSYGYIDLICNKATIAHFSKEKFIALPILVIPQDIQSKIVSFLDLECKQIDDLLSKSRSSIEEYKKLKQAVITQAVTKGVRGEREMKDSGVEWIGEIPKEWRKTQLRHCATIKSGITLGKSYSKDTVLIERPYLRVANVQGGYVDLNDLATIQVTPDEDLKYRLHSGDVLMTEGGDRDKLGRGCVWHGEIEPCLHQNHVFAVQTNETVLLPEFLEYLTASNVGRSYFDVTAIKTTNLACTSSSKVLAFTIPLPPIEEQIEIVSYIKKRSLELNKLIMKKELLVQELERYKKSLIYEVVTGKREV
ncbi:restriction endonuclease subunit S [Faecalibacterium langellae]|nr:restriction endonuclease subunit S [Faecalibacterium prausnitzii]